MLIRTVLDARPGASPRFLFQTCLLVASWKYWISHRFKEGLEVLALDQPPQVVVEFIRRLGARLLFADPSPTAGLSPTSNKLAATGIEGPLLLIDNDTCFVGDMSPWTSPREAEVMAARANGPRVSPSQWAYIRDTLGLKPLPREWMALDDEKEHLRNGAPLVPQKLLYLNAGVVWMRHPNAFGRTWMEHLARIYRAFDGHPLADDAVRGSDQAGFATAVGAHGHFEMLADVFNYRPNLIAMGQSDADDVQLVHMCGARRSGAGALSFDRLLRGWATHVIRGLTDEHAAQNAIRLFHKIEAIAAEFRLDALGLG